MCGIHPIFHISMLEPTAPNKFLSQTETPPPPIIIDGETEFEISEILDSKIDKHHKCKLQYLVKWSGYEGTDEETCVGISISKNSLKRNKYKNTSLPTCTTIVSS